MDSTKIQEFAPAKINLYLHILGRRDDGYHNLDSLVVFANIGDNLSLEKSSTYSLELSGPFATELISTTAEENLVLQAADVVAHCVKEIPPGGDIILEKNLPISAGIGGGSSDAAACIRALLKLHGHSLSDIARQQIALAVGADVSVCLHAKASRMMGAGHTVKPYKGLPDLFGVLVNPGVQISTAEIFSQTQLARGQNTHRQEVDLPARFASPAELCVFLQETSNDLQEHAMKQSPTIQTVLQQISINPDCLLSRMSGSGATCFGIFASQKTANKAAETLKFNQPEWWVKEVTLG